MPSPAKLYQREMHANMGYFATWLPGDLVKPGDVGVISDGQFRRQSSLSDLKVPIEIEVAGRLESVHYTSTKGTKVSTSAEAAVENVARAEIKIEFSSEGAFLFHASGLVTSSIKGRAALDRNVISLYQKGSWRGEWFLVNSVRVADLATIIVSQDRSADVTLAASGSEMLSSISLADPAAKFQVTSTRGKVLHLVGVNEISLLYTCLRVVDRMFGPPVTRPVLGPEETAALSVARPHIDVLLEA